MFIITLHLNKIKRKTEGTGDTSVDGQRE